MSHSAEYRKTFLAALAAVMVRGDSSVCQCLRQSTPYEEPVLPDCVDLLLGNLEDQRCGSEFQSAALYATSLLLSQWPDSRFGFFPVSTQSCCGSLPSLTVSCAPQPKCTSVRALVLHLGETPDPREP